MKHICDTEREYYDSLCTAMQGDTIYCTEELWKKLFKPKIHEEFGCSAPISFNTSEGIKKMEPGKLYDKDLNEI